MKKLQRFLSLRKIAALFPLDSSLSIVKVESLPESLQKTIYEQYCAQEMLHKSDLTLVPKTDLSPKKIRSILAQDMGNEQDSADFLSQGAGAVYVLVWLDLRHSDSSNLPQVESSLSLLPSDKIMGWQFLSHLNGPFYLTESFYQSYPLFKYINVGLNCQLPTSLQQEVSCAQVTTAKTSSATFAISQAQPLPKIHTLISSSLLDLQSHIRASACWVLSLTQEPSELLKTFKQEHIDIRPISSTDAADAQVGSMVLSLSLPLKNSLSKDSLSTQTLAPLPQTGAMYLDRMQRALAAVKDSAQQARALPQEELSSAEYYMDLALQEAQKAFALGEVPVGAVLVDSMGQVVAQGYNKTISTHDITSHAEMEAFRQAGVKLQNHRLNDLTLYVTLEPCCMCAMAAIHARIKRIVFGASEPKTGACGSQFSLAQDHRHNHQLEVFSGVLVEPCRKLLQDFFQQRRIVD